MNKRIFLTALFSLSVVAPAWATEKPGGIRDVRLEEQAWYQTDRADGRENYSWWKGNLHTHTLWSDGDSFPELVVEWYKENDYDFLALSDHNVLSEGEKWINIGTCRFLRGRGEEHLDEYIARFGEEWVDVREVDEELQARLSSLPATGGHRARRPADEDMELGATLVRLKSLTEFRGLFEEPGEFLLVQAEEITDGRVHVNATNLIEFVDTQGGDTVVEKMRNNIGAVLEQRKRTGQPMFPHLNHPNYRWAVTPDQMAKVEDLQFFEVYNGHPNVRNYGDENRPGTEKMWDVILTRRLAEMELGVVYGLATDDAHRYSIEPGAQTATTGKGWVVVRSPFLSPEHLIAGLEAGDFYSSSGVALDSIDFDGETLSIGIEGRRGESFTTRFIGTRAGYDPETEEVLDEDGEPLGRRYSDDVGEILAEVEGRSASYTLEGDEIYVRAVVISSELHPNPYREGDRKTAWVQPIVP